MDRLIRAQELNAFELERFMDNLKKTPKDRRKEPHLRKKAEMLDKLWANVQAKDREMLAQFQSEIHAELPYFQTDKFSALEDMYLDAHGIISEFLPQTTASTSLASSDQLNITTCTAAHDSNEVPLPRMNIPKFTGGYHDWVTFRGIFESLIHNNRKLSNVQKLHYLMANVSGEALQLIKHLHTTEANYAPAWELLKKRYQDERALTTFHIQSLLSLPNQRTENAVGLKRFLDSINESLEILKRLDLEVQSWDPLLIEIFTEKLCKDTIEHWEFTLNHRTIPSKRPTLVEFTDFLEARFKSLEAITRTRCQFPTPRKENIKGHITHTFTTSASSMCPACNRDHRLIQCTKFRSMTPKGRYEFIKTNSRCINCLSKSHDLKECPNPLNCQKCGKRHNSLLHFDQPKSPVNHNQSKNTKNLHQLRQHSQYSSHHVTSPQLLENSIQEVQYGNYQGPAHPQSSKSIQITPDSVHEDSYVYSHLTNNERLHTVLLATALVDIETPHAGKQCLRVLVDPGSQVSFITEEAVQRLRLRKQPACVMVNVVGDLPSGVSRNAVTCLVQSRYDPSFKRHVEAYVFPKISGMLPHKPIDHQLLPYLKNLPVADPNYMKPNYVDMLLGAEFYSEIILSGLLKGPKGYPIAIKTTLGWIISGRMPDFNTHTYTTPKVTLICTITESVDLENALKRFWELEDIPTYPSEPKHDECETIYAKSYYRDPTGRYVVPLTFENNKRPELGYSRNAALKRLLQMENKFQKNPKLAEDYKTFMKEYLTLGHMEKISSAENERDNFPEYVLPHHAVIKESSSTTKLRVVFDGSRKTTNGRSLNDTLLPGSPLQRDLCLILLRWRKFKIAFTADIEKMYRQIYIRPDQCKYQKILWRENVTQPIEAYRLLTVTYGTSCAPFLALRTLQQLANDERDRFPAASKILLTDFYVDDLMSGTNTLEEAIVLQENLRQLLQAGGFKLRKWVCNSERLLQYVPAKDREISTPFPIEFTETVKTLGIHWNPSSDSFEFKVSLDDSHTPVTKRILLSEAAKLFDPLGWLAPTVIIAKVMFQRLWIEGITWDELLPEHLQKKWCEFRQNLSKLELIKIPRWIELNDTETTYELHAFCDASSAAYAAVVYVRCVSPKGDVTISLLAAKTKVAPTRQVSIPRLELCGAVLLTKLITHVKQAIPAEMYQIYGWTDSRNVLAWIKGHPRQWQTFVGNRVSYIQERLDTSRWRYVKSGDNPADCASRGVAPGDLKDHPLWWTGPSWLQQDESLWPKNDEAPNYTDLEAKRVVLTITTGTELQLELINRYSTLDQLVRVTAYCRRFYINLKTAQPNRKFDRLSVEEINEAKLCLERLVQRTHFAIELEHLGNSQPVPKNSKLYSLNPIMDQSGLLRVGGRLRNAEIPADQKFPIILPEHSKFTELVINKCHQETLHGGTQLTLNLIRKKYWILNGRNRIRHQLHGCVTCFRYKASTQTQLMGDLPAPRVRQHRPFLHTGVDFTGHITIRESKCRGRPKTSKGYISVFVCLSTKAMHLELVSELTTEAFLAAFRRFVSRRGLCSDMYSDCGTNFIGANQQLIQARLKCEYGLSPNVITTLSTKGVKWHFIPPAAPHFGGLWEAGVKSVKYHFKRILGNSLLTYEEISTLLAQIEACLNSRPLCPLSNDPNDLQALTPGHFLIGDALLTPPEPNLLNNKLNTLSRWKLLQRLVQDFWKRWVDEYLPRLQARSKWAQRAPDVKKDHLVLIKDERLPPARWLLGRVIEVHPGPDGLTRAVTIRCKDSVLQRPITKICLLPIIDNQVS